MKIIGGSDLRDQQAADSRLILGCHQVEVVMVVRVVIIDISEVNLVSCRHFLCRCINPSCSHSLLLMMITASINKCSSVRVNVQKA